jgi:hypothetical protein
MCAEPIALRACSNGICAARMQAYGRISDTFPSIYRAPGNRGDSYTSREAIQMTVVVATSRKRSCGRDGFKAEIT